jgi:hypothetical protein
MRRQHTPYTVALGRGGSGDDDATEDETDTVNLQIKTINTFANLGEPRLSSEILMDASTH